MTSRRQSSARRTSAAAPPSDARDRVEPLALRARDAARLLAVSERTLWSLTAADQIPHVRIGRLVVYPVRALEAWLTARAGRTGRGRRDSSTNRSASPCHDDESREGVAMDASRAPIIVQRDANPPPEEA